MIYILLYASYSLSEEKRNGIHFVGNVSKIDIQTEAPIKRTSSEDILKKVTAVHQYTRNGQPCTI